MNMQSNPSFTLDRKASRVNSSPRTSRAKNHADCRRWLDSKAVAGNGWLCASPVKRKEQAA